MQRTRCAYFYDVTKPCNRRVPGSGCAAIGGLARTDGILGTSSACIAVHPSDLAVALTALDATVETTNGEGKTRSIPVADLHRLPLSETFAVWQRGILASVPEYLLNQARYRRWAEDADLDELEALLGTRPADLVEADRQLVAFIRSAGPERDAELIRLLHRRLLRQCLIIAGPDAPADHLALMKVEPLLDGRMDRVGDPALAFAE